MNEIQPNKKVDTDQFGSRYQEKAQEIAQDLTNPEKQVEVPKTEHDPFPAQSSKRAAIRTYKDYAAQSLSKGGGSLTKMIIAEREKKREQHRRSAANPKNVAMTLLSAVFVTLGLGMVVGAFFFVKTIQEDPRGKEVLVPEPLLIYDYRSEAYVPDRTRTKILREVTEQLEGVTIEVGAIKYIYFATDNQFGGKTLMSTQELLEGLRSKLSGTFLRSLDDNFMYGVFSTTDNAPFLILKTQNYSQAYAEMLAWERSIGLDIGDLFLAGDYDYARSSFVDVVYYNNDVRAILDIEGEPVLGYSFIDPRTIVVFSNKLALREVVDRTQRNTVKE